MLHAALFPADGETARAAILLVFFAGTLECTLQQPAVHVGCSLPVRGPGQELSRPARGMHVFVRHKPKPCAWQWQTHFTFRPVSVTVAPGLKLFPVSIHLAVSSVEVVLLGLAPSRGEQSVKVQHKGSKGRSGGKGKIQVAPQPGPSTSESQSRVRHVPVASK